MKDKLKRSTKGKSIYPKVSVWREPSRICVNIEGTIVDVKPDPSHHYGYPKLYERLDALLKEGKASTSNRRPGLASPPGSS